MTTSKENSLNIFKATTMLLSGAPVKPLDIIFFHGRSYGDDTGLFDLAGRMYRSKMAGKIIIPNSEGQRFGSNIPFEASPGKTAYARRLREQRVLRRDIIYPERTAYHTQQECDSFIELSSKEGWETAAILTQPHQTLRAALGMLKAMQDQLYVMEVYTISPKSTLWQQVVRGSQGLEAKPREDHIQEEFERIYRYQELGHLATFEDLFDYLRKRESGTLKLGRGLSISESSGGFIPPSHDISVS